MAVLLVTVQNDLDPIGLRSVHDYLIANAVDSHMLFLPQSNAHTDADMETIRKFVAELTPAFIGFSVMSCEYRESARISAFFKKHFPQTPILWGGIHPTIDPE